MDDLSEDEIMDKVQSSSGSKSHVRNQWPCVESLVVCVISRCMRPRKASQASRKKKSYAVVEIQIKQIGY